MSLPSACLHSQGPHLAVSGGEHWENSRLVRAKTLTVNIKERQRRRVREKELSGQNKAGFGEPGAHNKHDSFTAHPGHCGKWGGH